MVTLHYYSNIYQSLYFYVMVLIITSFFVFHLRFSVEMDIRNFVEQHQNDGYTNHIKQFFIKQNDDNGPNTNY